MVFVFYTKKFCVLCAKQQPVFSAADADISGEESRVSLKGYSEPPKRSAGIRIKEKEAADAVSKAMEKMLQDKAL